MHSSRNCLSCAGTGERPSDYGSTDCPDCGGSGILPSRSVHTDWRARDIEKALATGTLPQSQDLRWLLTELHAARRALTDIITLAHDVVAPDPISMQIRSIASTALGLYDQVSVTDDDSAVPTPKRQS
jgi:hypothetical protein